MNDRRSYRIYCVRCHTASSTIAERHRPCSYGNLDNRSIGFKNSIKDFILSFDSLVHLFYSESIFNLNCINPSELTMKRFGEARSGMKQIQHHHVFLSRLRLLVIMAKAFTGNYPMGEHRLKAIARNAETVVRDCVDWHGYHKNFRSNPESNRLLEVDHIFYQRVKLLAIMAKSFAEGSPVGQHRRMAIRSNINYICEALQFVPEEENLKLLKVA